MSPYNIAFRIHREILCSEPAQNSWNFIDLVNLLPEYYWVIKEIQNDPVSYYVWRKGKSNEWNHIFFVILLDYITNAGHVEHMNIVII
jgi:hypothetical protein